MGFNRRLLGWICRTAVLVIAGVIFHAPVSYGLDKDMERGIQERLIQSREVLERACGRLESGVTAKDEIEKIIALAGEIRAYHALLEEKFRIRGEDVKTRGSRAFERHMQMEGGYLRALQEYLGHAEQLDPASTDQGVIRTLKSLLERILPVRRRPLLGALPYRDPGYPPKEPYTGVSIRPAYRGGQTREVMPEDTKETQEAPYSVEIATVAQSLGWSPVRIYEYVMNNIETQWYRGCMKGAEETLRQQAGNDCDQATLLVALMRVSGFPSRYVRGTIEFFAGGRDGVPMEKGKNLTGIDDPAKIAEFFQKAGIPYKPVITGGRITNFQIEHIWVETQVPYGNYRGAIIDDSDKTWLGLDTSIKIRWYQYNEPLDVFQQPSLSTGLPGLRDEYLGSIQTQTPLQYLREMLQRSGRLAEDYKTARELPMFIMDILPNSMQFVHKTITHEYTEIPDDLRHKVRFTAAAGNPSATLFDVTVDTWRLSNQMITMTYEPETVEDQQIMDSYGGLDNTPAYLLRLRPVLKINGERMAVGKDGLPMGEDLDLMIEPISPNGTERVTSTQITGNMVAIGITAGKVGAPLAAPSEDDDAESILSKEAYRYIDRWNKAEDELAAIFHLNITRPIPTVVTVGGVIDVTYLLDMPHGFQWKGVFVDAGMRAVSVIPTLANGGFSGDRQKTFMTLSALEGSILENRIFEDDLQVDSISTAKLIQVARVLRVPVLQLDKANIESIPPGLESGMKDSITDAVNEALKVTVPNNEISYEDWRGAGYIKEDHTTGESGYMLSGMIAGGMTAVSPDKWPLRYSGVLGKPYGKDYTSIAITYPRNESVVTEARINVAGVVMDSDIPVAVNGVPALVSGNSFTAEGIALNRGMNTITASGLTREGKAISKGIRVKYRIPLLAYITFPFDSLDISGTVLDVEGVVSDNLASVEVNGITAAVSADGRFIARAVGLSPGLNQITAKATNTEGESYVSTITVMATEPEAPSFQIAITAPHNNEVINRPSVAITGTVTTNADEVSVKVGGVLAEVSDGRFAANHVPLAEGDNVITVYAIDSKGATAKASVTVRTVDGPFVTLNANIASGIPPLTSYFTVSTELPNRVLNYQMDFEGDGVIDYTGENFDNITHEYTAEGVYHPTITVTDDKGNVYTDTIAVTVLNREKIDALLKGKWEKMKEALVRGDVEGAVVYFADELREKYRRVFSTLKDTIPSIASSMSEIYMNHVIQGVAEYRIGRAEVVGGQSREITYFIYFERNVYGVWKIESF